ncbi:HlyD family secretion protein [Pseudoduganella buxea]|uniref:HlyD family efflux transporter periplasmic adaptor subunit n=1 Tax=Pseudoduganella buxea TaxID=1949069 RepID=A0A6I3T2Y0_9BURK|nr:HlyD family efflux transporter periplasmic adaptor subunit [Pseudoduganella buxea]MTV55116.1 HlyD family efflux transporter periplasmic adaptor subunit [Pseudoduganella buxea]GGC05758.1 secretion protein [Pseudoduganella buxea]
MSLFRPAALNARQVKWLGEIILIRPLSFAVLTALAVGAAAIIVAFLCIGTYTKRSTVGGQLVPDRGLVKVYASQAGIVLEKRVHEGQRVRRGDVLFVVSGERSSSTQSDIQAAISRKIEMREQSLRKELDKTGQLQLEERVALDRKIAGLESELAKIENQLEGQRSRVQLAEETVRRSEELLAKSFVSKEQVQQKQADLLDQRSRLQALERDRLSGRRELVSQENARASAPLRDQNLLAQIARQLTSTGEELTESEARRRLVVTAPEDGIATAVAVETGQAVDGSRPLVSVVPAGALMQAHLYAPSSAIGFVQPGDTVLLRYQAYPYQKFGHARGRVVSVSKTALPSNELSGLGWFAANGAGSSPLYLVTVRLERQSVTAYGKQQAIQAGMLLDADVLRDTRRLYEWVLEPLFSMTGHL